MKLATLLALMPLVACGVAAPSASDERSTVFAQTFVSACVETDARPDRIDRFATEDSWLKVEDAGDGRTAWTALGGVLGERRLASWVGDVEGTPSNLCMVIALGDADDPRLEAGATQRVRYWFFERGGHRNYLEVREALSGDVAGSVSVALGVPLNGEGNTQ